VGVVRKKSFIVGKGKGITCFTRRERFPCQRKEKKKSMWFILGHLYTTLNLEAGRNYVSLLGSSDLRATGRSWA
jgi:hypothetical protein